VYSDNGLLFGLDLAFDGKMEQRHRELIGRDVSDNLEFLREYALELARKLRSEIGMFPDEPSLKDKAQKLVNRFREKNDLLTERRVTRIIRHKAPLVFGIDHGADPSREATASWCDTIVENIEHELDVIDRKRALWLAVIAASLAALAALISAIGVILQVFGVLRSPY
jgi:tetrahydromethanopterin S-methyltransferase subunit F